MITEEEALHCAKMMSELERRVILECQRTSCLHGGYSGIAKQIGETYENVQKAGKGLQKLGLARISTTYVLQEFNGSAIFLSDRGEVVREAVSKLMFG